MIWDLIMKKEICSLLKFIGILYKYFSYDLMDLL